MRDLIKASEETLNGLSEATPNEMRKAKTLDRLRKDLTVLYNKPAYDEVLSSRGYPDVKNRFIALLSEVEDTLRKIPGAAPDL